MPAINQFRPRFRQGVETATVLTLFVLPALYYFFAAKLRWIR